MDRRNFLIGLGGATVALPVLESLAPRREARAQARPPAPGFVVIFRQANGVQQADRHWATGFSEPENFWPHAPGPMTAANVMGRALEELGPWVPRLLAVAGVQNSFAGLSCAHTSACNTILSAARVERFGGMPDTHALGPSMDNLLAERLNPAGRGPLFVQSGPQVASAQVAAMSYVGPRMRRNPDFSPLVVYNRMMGMPAPRDIAGEQRLLQRRSVNDLVREQMAHLLARPQLSADDRRRLEIHQQNIRDAEMHMATSCALSAEAQATFTNATNATYGTNGSRLYADHNVLHEVTRLHIDVAALALACGYTRIAVISVGAAGGGTDYALSGLPNGRLGYHKISHRGTTDGDPSMDPSATILRDAWEAHRQVDRIHARTFRYLLDKLAMTSTARGPLIDQGVAVWLSDMAAGSHRYTNIPVVCAGTANGFLRSGAYVDVRAGGQWVTHNKLLNTLINAAGVRKADGALWDDFGDSSLARGVIPQMIAGM